MIAYFALDGRVIAIGSGTMGPPPGTEYIADVPDGTDPNSVYYDSGAVVERHPFPITIEDGRISEIPAGTIARISGGISETIESGALTLPEGVNRWVRLEHPHYLAWAGNVPEGPDE